MHSRGSKIRFRKGFLAQSATDALRIHSWCVSSDSLRCQLTLLAGHVHNFYIQVCLLSMVHRIAIDRISEHPQQQEPPAHAQVGTALWSCRYVHDQTPPEAISVGEQVQRPKPTVRSRRPALGGRSGPAIAVLDSEFAREGCEWRWALETRGRGLLQPRGQCTSFVRIGGRKMAISCQL